MIYGLYNKNTGEVRYVGRTQQSKKRRLSKHIYTSEKNKKNSPKARWIRKLGSESVGIKLLEENPENEDEAELWWMEYLEYLGCNLLNVVKFPSGGYIGQGCVEITDEMKKDMAGLTGREVAEKYNVNYTTVVKHRSRLEIEAPGHSGMYHGMKKLPKECIEKLGTTQDHKLAKKYGVSRSLIQNRRKERKIDCVGQEKVKLPNSCVEKLGTVPDVELADRYDTSKGTIQNRREEENILSYGKRVAGEVKWLLEHTKYTHQEIAEGFGISRKTVGNIKRDETRAEQEPIKPKLWDRN